MFVWKKWTKIKRQGIYVYSRHYKMLSLFGFIPLWISINVIREGANL